MIFLRGFSTATGPSFTITRIIIQSMGMDAHTTRYLTTDYNTPLINLEMACASFPNVLTAFRVYEGDGSIHPGNAFLVPFSTFGDWMPAIFYRPILPLYHRSYNTIQDDFIQDYPSLIYNFENRMIRAAGFAQFYLDQGPINNERGAIVMVPQHAVRDWVPALVYQPQIPDLPPFYDTIYFMPSRGSNP